MYFRDAVLGSGGGKLCVSISVKEVVGKDTVDIV